jgi:hypothetical protein
VLKAKLWVAGSSGSNLSAFFGISEFAISGGSWRPVRYARFLFICLASMFKKEARSIGRR